MAEAQEKNVSAAVWYCFEVAGIFPQIIQVVESISREIDTRITH